MEQTEDLPATRSGVRGRIVEVAGTHGSQVQISVGNADPVVVDAALVEQFVLCQLSKRSSATDVRKLSNVELQAFRGRDSASDRAVQLDLDWATLNLNRRDALELAGFLVQGAMLEKGQALLLRLRPNDSATRL